MVKLNEGDKAARSVLCEFISSSTVILEKFAKRCVTDATYAKI